MIVLDTHIWLWWVNGNSGDLSPARRKSIESSEQVAVSAISCFEIACDAKLMSADRKFSLYAELADRLL